MHRVPLADRHVGPVHGGHVHPHQQHFCVPKPRQRRLLLSGDADSQSHLCPGQRGPGSSQKVRVAFLASTDSSPEPQRSFSQAQGTSFFSLSFLSTTTGVSVYASFPVLPAQLPASLPVLP